jgi:hypothetical protein
VPGSNQDTAQAVDTQSLLEKLAELEKTINIHVNTIATQPHVLKLI